MTRISKLEKAINDHLNSVKFSHRTLDSSLKSLIAGNVRYAIITLIKNGQLKYPEGE